MYQKSVTAIRNELLELFNQLLPNLDLTEGTPERDIFIEVPIAGQLSAIWDGIAYTQKLHAPLIYYDELEEDEIDKYCSTYGINQLAATYSTGNVTFFTTTEPTADIPIPDGTVVSTVEAIPIEFSVDGSYTLSYSIRNSYYNASTERWEITVPVRAVLSGPDYRAGSNTITLIKTTIPNLEGCTNTDPVVGGENAETIIERLRRVSEKFQGRDLGTTAGIRSYLGTYTRYINVVGSNDPLMLRDEGLGGAVDIYIIGEDLETTSDTVNITSTGLELGLNVSYTSTGITLIYQPVSSINSVIKNGITLDTSYYSLVKDTGILALSTDSVDKIELTSTGLANIGPFVNGDTIEVSYIYNNLLHLITEDLNSEGNHFQNRDYLLREMTPVTIDVYIKFKEVAGQDFDTVADAVELDISEFITDIKNTGDVELADIISVAKSSSGVDNVDLTTAELTNTGGGSLSAQGDVLLVKNEYPVSGTITLVRWTN